MPVRDAEEDIENGFNIFFVYEKNGIIVALYVRVPIFKNGVSVGISNVIGAGNVMPLLPPLTLRLRSPTCLYGLRSG